jgi:CRP-like cAMP-binding protein
MAELTRALEATPSRAALMFPTLTPAQIARVAAHGVRRRMSAGEVLFEPGDRPPFFVVIAGKLEIVRPSDNVETMVAEEGRASAKDQSRFRSCAVFLPNHEHTADGFAVYAGELRGQLDRCTPVRRD